MKLRRPLSPGSSDVDDPLSSKASDMKSRMPRAQTFNRGSGSIGSTFKNELGKSDENKDLGLGEEENKDDDFFYFDENS